MARKKTQTKVRVPSSLKKRFSINKNGVVKGKPSGRAHLMVGKRAKKLNEKNHTGPLSERQAYFVIKVAQKRVGA